MDRKSFIKSCGFACAGGLGLTTVLQGCSSTKLLSGQIVKDDLVIMISDFATRDGRNEFRKYIVVHNELLQYPICVYRINDKEYSAVWMRCTHQGAELQVFGDKLQCPAHGSEFSNKGIVQNGPAASTLRTFPVIIEDDRLKISLKAI